MNDKSKKNPNETNESLPGIEELDESLHPFVNKSKKGESKEEEPLVDDIYGVDLGDDPEEKSEELDEEEESEEIDDEEEESEETDEDEDEDEDEEETLKSKDDRVPIKKLMKEKAKNKSLLRRLEALEEKFESDEASRLKSTLLKKYEEAGHDTDLVRDLLDDVTKLISINKRDTSEDKIMDDIEDLSTDDLFSDALDYSDQIIQRITDFKKAGVKLSVEDAYFSIVGKSKIKSKIKDKSIRDAATKRLKSKQTSTRKTNPEKDTGHKTSNTYGLSKKDIKNFQKLKQMQPNAGWTLSKYARYTTRSDD